MSTFKEKIISLVVGGCLLSLAGALKGLVKFVSRESGSLTKHEIFSMGSKKTSHFVAESQVPTKSGFDSSIKSHANSAVFRVMVHHVPKWEDVFGGVDPISVSPKPSENNPLSGVKRPPYVDLRAWDNPIKNQGSEGACTAYATVAAMENQLNQTYQAKVKLSEDSLWKMYKKPHILSAIEGAQGLNSKFVTLESFNGMKVQNGNWISFVEAPYGIRPLKNIENIIDIVASHRPVILGTVVNQSFDHGGKGWIDPDSPGTGTGHAVTIVGYKIDPKSNDQSYFIIRNSWGEQWGDRGYGYLPFSYCEKFFCSGFSLEKVHMVDASTLSGILR